LEETVELADESLCIAVMRRTPLLAAECQCSADMPFSSDDIRAAIEMHAIIVRVSFRHVSREPSDVRCAARTDAAT